MEFKNLPQEVQNKIKSTLRAYDKVNVVFENGCYNVSTGIVITATYAPDHEFIGEYKAKEIFTEEQQIINYMESFLSFPINYKGQRNWEIITKMKELKKEGKQAKLIMVNGNVSIDRIEDLKRV